MNLINFAGRKTRENASVVTIQLAKKTRHPGLKSDSEALIEQAYNIADGRYVQ